MPLFLLRLFILYQAHHSRALAPTWGALVCFSLNVLKKNPLSAGYGGQNHTPVLTGGIKPPIQYSLQVINTVTGQLKISIHQAASACWH